MAATIQRFVTSLAGERVSWGEALHHPIRYLIPTGLLVTAAALLVLSLQRPYWHMTLRAPQYPQGLHVTSYVNHLEGDVDEIDELNHYIGMRKLNEAARLEKAAAVPLIWTMAALLLAATAIHNRWSLLLVVPALIFPLFFLLDLHFWLDHFGQHLDPHAALSSTIKPFTPPVLGIGKIGQFRTIARPGEGLILASYASIAVLVGLWFHRAAYKPLAAAKGH